MTPEQKAAFVHAQAVAASAEIAGMNATNKAYEIRGDYPPCHAGDFDAVIEKYGLHSNALIEFFRD